MNQMEDLDFFHYPREIVMTTGQGGGCQSIVYGAYGRGISVVSMQLRQ